MYVHVLASRSPNILSFLECSYLSVCHDISSGTNTNSIINVFQTGEHVWLVHIAYSDIKRIK